MHELSIAQALADLVAAHVEPTESLRVRKLHVSLGALCSVDADALRTSFELVARETFLETAELVLVPRPVQIYCPTCDAVVELSQIQAFLCPHCGTPSGDVRQGLELTLDSIELVEE